MATQEHSGAVGLAGDDPPRDHAAADCRAPSHRRRPVHDACNLRLFARLVQRPNHPKTEKTMTRLVYILNGPNLNLLGKRQPQIYGSETLADVERDCEALAGELGLSIRFLQTNYEGQIVDWIHQAREEACGIVINPAALTHTSVAVLDALNAFEGPVIEVHISQIHKREAFRHHSYVSHRADAIIAGAGTQGYQFGMRRIAVLMEA